MGPGGNLGGLEWGSATDNKRVYVANTNTSHIRLPHSDEHCSGPELRQPRVQHHISKAIAAVASSGHVVVCNGTFHESVSVTKPLSLEGRSDAIVDATQQINGIAISAPNVTVTGLTVENAVGEGILINGVNNVTVNNNIVSGNDRGAGSNAVPNSYHECAGTAGSPGDCGGGIHIMASSNSVISGNTSRANAAGIVVSDETAPAAHNLISLNSLLDNPLGSGITLAGRNTAGAPDGVPAPSAGGIYSNTISSNTTSDNGLTAGGAGIDIVTRTAGAAVYNNIVDGNIATGNGYAGVAVHSFTHGQDVNGNIVRNNTIGTNNTIGDSTVGPVTDRQTTGILLSTVDPLSIQLTGNAIANDHFGIWTLGPVTASDANQNSFSAVDVPISSN